FAKLSTSALHHIRRTFVLFGGWGVFRHTGSVELVSGRQLLMVTAPEIVPRVEEERYLALLRASNAIATCSDCSTASDTLIRTLRDVTTFDCLHLVAFDKDTNASTWSVLEANGKIIDSPPGDFSPENSPFQLVHSSGQHLLTSDWSRESRFEEYGLFLANLGIA